ncbi:MAG: hypothetical protein IJM37_01275 [Lachnospiraceae bacterium]|nr:hypothetical protein [Lachnospiraceae bacterium]
MKRIIFAVLVCAVLLSGCTKTTDSESLKKEVVPIEGFTNTEYNPETDNQYYFSEYSGLVAVDGGYYKNYGGFLYFFDKKSKENHPVCSNLSCDHKTENCDAYLGDASYLQYYEGYLYYVIYDYDNKEAILYRKSPDGSVVEKIGELLRADLIPDITIHRGYAYFAWDSKNDSTLYRIKLKKDAVREKLFVYDAKFDPSIYRIKGYGDGVMFETSYYLNNDYTGAVFNLYYYDSGENAVKLVKVDTGGDYIIADGMVYYYKGDGVYQYDISTRTESMFYPIEEMVFVSYDGRYLYLNNEYALNWEQISEREHRVYVVDMNGQLIDTIPVPEYICYYGDKDYLFQSMAMGYQMLDKTQLGTGKQEWIKIPMYNYQLIED